MTDITPEKRSHVPALFLIHVLTASGAPIALAALLAGARGNWQEMFVWLGLALVVDGIDGPSRASTTSRNGCRAGLAHHWISSSTTPPTYSCPPLLWLRAQCWTARGTGFVAGSLSSLVHSILPTTA
ncbi:hypothetical protein V6L77_24420 [Pannonibacter sp. Pt2-lr]